MYDLVIDERRKTTHSFCSRRRCTCRGGADTLRLAVRNFIGLVVGILVLSLGSWPTSPFRTLACDRSEEASVPHAMACKLEALGAVLGGELYPARGRTKAPGARIRHFVTPAVEF